MIKIAYYVLLGIFTLVGLFYFFATLLDLPQQNSQWLAGLGMIGGMLLFGKIHWQ